MSDHEIRREVHAAGQSPSHRLRIRRRPTLWPEGPLDAAERAFQILAMPPAPLAIDGRAHPGMPRRIMGLDEVRAYLLTVARRRDVTDGVWRELITRARRDGPAWVVIAVGMALPGLRRRAAVLTRGWNGDRNDLDSDLLLGFLERLQTIDVDDPNLCSRLIDAGARAVKRSRRHDTDAAALHDVQARSVPPARPWDHPDFVLARAVAAGIISSRDAGLIALTRLEGDTISGIAQDLDLPVSTVTSWRYRAERHLAAAISAGELHWVGLTPSS